LNNQNIFNFICILIKKSSYLFESLIYFNFSDSSDSQKERAKQISGKPNLPNVANLKGNIGSVASKKELNENTTPEEIIDDPLNKKVYEYKNGVNLVLIYKRFLISYSFSTRYDTFFT